MHARKQIDILDACDQRRVGQRRDISAGEHALGRKAQRLDEMAHHRFVITGNDLDADTRGCEPRNRVCRAGLGRIDKDAESGKHQVMFVTRLRLHAIFWHRLPGHGQQPVAARRLLVLYARHTIARDRVKEQRMTVAGIRHGRSRQYGLRSALDDQGALAVLLGQNGDAPAFEIERDFIDFPPAFG